MHQSYNSIENYQAFITNHVADYKSINLY